MKTLDTAVVANALEQKAVEILGWPVNAKQQWLRDHEWSQWYHPDYWVHPKTVQNSEVQDYTNYGLSLDAAIAFETGDTPCLST